MEVSVKKQVFLTNKNPIALKIQRILRWLIKTSFILAIYFEVFMKYLLEHKLLEWRFLYEQKIYF